VKETGFEPVRVTVFPSITLSGPYASTIPPLLQKTPAVSVDQTVLLGVVTGYVFPVTRMTIKQFLWYAEWYMAYEYYSQG
jgi:hypothetical protein